MARTLFPLMLLVSSIGCGVCLYQPLHTEETLFFAPELLGRWRSDRDNRIWRFGRGEGGSYSLGSNLSDATRIVYLTRLGGVLFMTATNSAIVDDPDRPGCRYMLSGKLELQDGRLTLRAVDAQALADLLGRSEEAPPHHVSRDRNANLVVLTGEPQRLQSFLSTHANAPGLFDDSSIMTFTKIGDRE